MKRKVVRLTENDLHRIVKNSVNRILRESYMAHNKSKRLNESQILDNLCLQVEPDRYGEFSIRDTNSWLQFGAEAYISHGKLEVSVGSDCDDARADQLCNSDAFNQMCASAILSDSPDNIRGFQEFADDLGDWDEAIEDLRQQLDYEADTIEKKNERIKRNMKASSPDFYSAKYGW